jgi:HemY protein
MMLKRLLILFALVLGAAMAASWLAQQPGEMQVDWLGQSLKLPTSLAVALMVIFALTLVFLDRILRAIKAMPGWFGGRLRERRAAAGHRALTLGLMAVSAGEPDAARKQAGRASRLLDAPELTGLLAAQAAHLAGDHQAARRYFTSILADRETAFLGQVGLMRLALDDGDAVRAHDAARAALALNPKSELAARALLKLETDRGNWQAALPALTVIQKRQAKGTKPSETAETLRRQVAIHYLAGRDQCGDDADAQMRSLEKALKIDPGFLPAVRDLADRHLDRNAHGKATKILEAGFKHCPHADLLSRLKAAWKANDGQFIGRLEKLVGSVVPARRAAAFALAATAATKAGMDGEAARLTHEAAALALDADAGAPPHAPPHAPLHAWQCVSCKSLHEDWSSHCPACGEFATLFWQRPERVTPMIPSKASKPY